MKKRFSLLLVILLAASMILAACGDGKDNGDEGSGDSGKTEQYLRVNIKTEPFSLHPGLANDSTSGSVLRNTFEGLTRIGLNGEPENAMAEDIQVSEDGTVYTFTLRDAKWSNGDPVIAQDFEYAWKWALDPANESQYAYQLYYLKNGAAANEGKVSLDEVGVKAIDEKTLEVTLEQPTPYFLELTAFYTYLPVNSKIAEANPDWYKNAGEDYVSNGPFKMASWEHRTKIELVKNDQYWDKDNVKLEKIDMHMIDDENTELSMFQKGELDWAGAPFSALPTDAIPQLKKDGDLNIKPIAGVYWYKFNTEVEPFNNVKIRKAFSYAINRQAITDNILQAGQIPAMAAVPPSMFQENEDGYYKDNNLEEAKKLLQEGLEELGYKDVSELPTITISYNTSEAHQKIAQAIQDMWRKNLGVETELENEEWAVYIEKLHNGDFMIGRMGWLGDFNDPINFLELFREKDGGNNDTRWENAEFKQLLLDSQEERDPDVRMQMLKQAEEIFIDEMPVAPIYFYTNAWLQPDNLKDVAISGLGDVQLKWAYFE
ncbi:peptide ABC transporter substrate-binding protein [Fervidibacillus halotolerans]|uniref:Peptide ABC transporter substrate-binding protein n=1 Tax=Fervidibacillus halotolerans TaxID=2980027 RepID=A0A9E8RXK5_9BACI|nr:peptide ABC transporter substrate-binding protein [Fervidibacillus halotolerans]WAA11866.1 peptide ABC transporter substrate-binding protein [Fervidibacillus halotolerans]